MFETKVVGQAKYKGLLPSVTTNVNRYTESAKWNRYSRKFDLHILFYTTPNVLKCDSSKLKENTIFELCGRCKESFVAVRRIIVIY